MVKAIRPFVRKFHSSEYINALAGGDICLAFGFSGDMLQARDRAPRRPRQREIAYAIPKRGLAALDRRRRHSQGRAQCRQRRYSSSTSCSSPRSPPPRAPSPATPTPTRRRRALIDKAISADPLIYPPADGARAGSTRSPRAPPTRRASARGCGPRSRRAVMSRTARSSESKASTKRFGAVAAVDERRSRDRARRALRAAGRLGLRQDHPAAPAGGLRAAGRAAAS